LNVTGPNLSHTCPTRHLKTLTTRINVRLNTPHRKETNSNGNQVCRVFSRTQWECILFVCYETTGFDLDPNFTQSSDDRHRDTWSVDHRREIHGSLEVRHDYLLVFTFPPSLFGCSMFQDVCPVFFEKKGTQSKKCENFCESVGIEI
jgi:hypothetical protein